MKSKRTVLHPDQRRQQLVGAATWVFARKGYRTASIGDIIIRAGVARGTFYLYFKGKEQVFLSIVEDFYNHVSRALAELSSKPELTAEEGAEAFLRKSVRQWLGFFAANRDATTVILREASSVDPRFERGFAELRQLALTHFAARFRYLQTLGLVRPSTSPDFIAHLQLGMFDELLRSFVLTDPDADLDTLAAQVADFEYKAFGPTCEG